MSIWNKTMVELCEHLKPLSQPTLTLHFLRDNQNIIVTYTDVTAFEFYSQILLNSIILKTSKQIKYVKI